MHRIPTLATASARTRKKYNIDGKIPWTLTLSNISNILALGWCIVQTTVRPPLAS